MQAQTYYRQALEIIDRVLRETFGVLSDAQQLAMVRSLRQTLDGYLSASAQFGHDVEQPYHYVLAWKGSVFMRQRCARLGALRPELGPLLAELHDISSHLANLLILRPPEAKRRLGETKSPECLKRKNGWNLCFPGKARKSSSLSKGRPAIN